MEHSDTSIPYSHNYGHTAIYPYIIYIGVHVHMYTYVSIRESVDSLCRDGADTPMPPYIGKAFTRTGFKPYMIIVCE